MSESYKYTQDIKGMFINDRVNFDNLSIQYSMYVFKCNAIYSAFQDLS